MFDRDNIQYDVGQTILSTYSADGYLGIGVDVPGQEQAGTSTFDARFPFGTFGRPRDPDVSADGTRRIGATTLYGYAGTSRHAWPLDDPRVWPKLPQAPKGTWGAYADTGNAELPVMVLDGTTGSWAVRVPHAPYTGTASSVRVDVETQGAEEIVLAHGGGCEVRVRATEAIVGDPLLAVALARATALDGVIAALETFATALTGAVDLAAVIATGATLTTELGTIPPVPTTKLRSE